VAAKKSRRDMEQQLQPEELENGLIA